MSEATAEEVGPGLPARESLGRSIRESGWFGVVRRVPFTASYVTLTLVLSVALGTLWRPVDSKSWFQHVGFGLPAFEDGRWYTLITGLFFALNPVYYLFVAGFFAVLTGFAEWRLGTWRTVVIALGGQIIAVLVVALGFRIFRSTSWEWAAQRSTELDVGFSAGMLAVVAVASATLRPPWRLRVRLALWFYVLFSLFVIGQMADAEHFVAVVLTLPFSSRLAGKKAVPASAWPSRREWRLLAAIGSLFSAGVQVVDEVLPDRLTVFGPTDGETETGWVFVVTLLITLLIFNGLRRGYRWAWWLQLIQNGLVVALSLLVGVVWLATVIAPDLEAEWEGLPNLAANAVFSGSLFVFLLVARSSFRTPRKSRRRLATDISAPDTAKTLLHRWGGSTISWMTTWPDNFHLVTADGESYLAFRRHAGVAVALGDPVGPPGTTEATLQAFVDMCERAALVPYLFSCTAVTADVTDRWGWQSAQVAEDNLIDLPELEFKGKKWQDIRTALNRAPKENITFRMMRLSEESWSMVRQVEQLSQEWLGEKELPEMGFTLGGVTEALDPEVLVGIAVDTNGTVHGVTSWLPVFGGDDKIAGWTLDLMRRRDGGFRSTIEFLIASSCLYFKDQGAQFVSLSGAPLARSDADPAEETLLDKFLDTLGATLEPVYGFRSLHAFKAKFQPRLSPMLMVYRDEADLPRIGIAITRAYLPDSGLRDLLSVVKH